jgi:hypothetical protein
LAANPSRPGRRGRPTAARGSQVAGGPRAARRPLPATGLNLVDALPSKAPPSLDDYVAAVSQYVRQQATLDDGQRKAAQIRLSSGLGEALLGELRRRLPSLTAGASAGEQAVSGALRVAQLDLLEFHPLDGLRLAVEIKPVNLAVGRALWNRFGDIRVTAVNVHLKFPFAVIGGVLAIPTYEEVRRKAGQVVRKGTTSLILRAVDRLVRAGGRRSEADAAHLLEGVCVIAYDPETGKLEPDLPPTGSGLRWEEFVEAMATAYEARFGSDASDLRDRMAAEDASPDI